VFRIANPVTADGAIEHPPVKKLAMLTSLRSLFGDLKILIRTWPVGHDLMADWLESGISLCNLLYGAMAKVLVNLEEFRLAGDFVILQLKREPTRKGADC